MKHFFYLIIFFIAVQAPAQEKLTLYDCHQKAIENHPLGLQKVELEKINQLNTEVISSSYLPQLKFNGQATYQSDIVSIDLDIPGVNLDIPSPTKDQYKMAVELNQVIYDGGLAKNRKGLEMASYNADLQQVEVDLYSLKEQVNNVFFQVFVLEENLELIKVTRNSVVEKLKSVKSGVENGVLLPTDKMKLEAELLKLDQTIEELKISIKTSRDILEILTGEELENTELAFPENIEVSSESFNRPEHILFQYQKDKLISAGKLKASEKMPKLYGFGQLGYGRPGLNMLNDEFDSYYMVGLTLSWNFWDWEKTKNERQVYKVQENIVKAKQSVFDQNLKIKLESAQSEIKKLEKSIEKDNQLITLQNQILENISSQLDHGVITSTEYITQLNAVTQAKISLKSHEIQLVQARINVKTIQGNL